MLLPFCAELRCPRGRRRRNLRLEIGICRGSVEMSQGLHIVRSIADAISRCWKLELMGECGESWLLTVEQSSSEVVSSC